MPLVDEDLVARSSITYLEGYLWDRPSAKAACRKAADICRKSGGKLALTLMPLATAPLVKQATSSMPAYLLYLRGKHYLAKRTEEGFRKAINCFDVAIESDPTYAPAHAGLANAYILFGFDEYRGLPPELAMPRGKAAAQRALELDPTLAEPHAALGWVSLFYEWDWGAAEREFQRAIALQANLAVGHHWYALYLTAMGRAEQSIAELHRTLATRCSLSCRPVSGERTGSPGVSKKPSPNCGGRWKWIPTSFRRNLNWRACSGCRGSSPRRGRCAARRGRGRRTVCGRWW